MARTRRGIMAAPRKKVKARAKPSNEGSFIVICADQHTDPVYATAKLAQAAAEKQAKDEDQSKAVLQVLGVVKSTSITSYEEGAKLKRITPTSRYPW